MGWHVDKLQYKQDLTKAEKTQDEFGLQLQYWKIYSRTLRSIQMYYNKTTAAKCCKSNEYSCASCHCYHSEPVSFSASSAWFGYAASSKLKCVSQVTGQDTIFLKMICRFVVMDLPRGELCSSTVQWMSCNVFTRGCMWGIACYQVKNSLKKGAQSDSTSVTGSCR